LHTGGLRAHRGAAVAHELPFRFIFLHSSLATSPFDSF
jgi:hypothetical protein